MEEIDFLKEDKESTSKDAKWNLFKFQDHLTYWIGVAGECIFQRDYPSTFEALTVLYTDTRGFFSEKEQEKLDNLFKKCQEENIEYLSYNINYTRIVEKVRSQTYMPPSGLYVSLLEFKFRLMEAMNKHQLLIPMIQKGVGIATER